MNDGDLGIELGETATFLRPCCGRVSETVHGYIFDAKGETTVYFAGYAPGHPVRHVNMLISIGEWGEGTSSADRTAIVLNAVAFGDGLDFEFPPPEDSPWYQREALGRFARPDELSAEQRHRALVSAKFAANMDPRVARYVSEDRR